MKRANFMRHKLLLLAATMAAGLFASAASASVCVSSSIYGITDCNRPQPYVGIAATRTSIENTDSFGGRGFVGLIFNRNFSIELGFTQAGGFHYESKVLTRDVDLYYFTLDFLAAYPVNDTFSPYVRLGAARYSYTVTQTKHPEVSNSGFSLHYGIGMSVNFTDNAALRFEWSRIQIGDLDMNASTLKLGISYMF